MNLTQQNISAIKGMAAFLPNQPMIHNCIVDPTTETPLQPGDIVTFATTSLIDSIVVKQAANTDIPIGIVAYSSIKTGYYANDRITIYPVNSFVYMEAGAANLTNGQTVGFNSDNQVVVDSTSGHGTIGTVWTQPNAIGDLIVVQINPGTVGGNLNDYLTISAAQTTYQPKLTAGTNVSIDTSTNTISATDTKYTAGKFVSIDTTSNTITTTYTAGANITISSDGEIAYSA